MAKTNTPVARLGGVLQMMAWNEALALAAIVGAELSNVGCKLMLYQNDRASSTYVNFGPLRHPRF